MEEGLADSNLPTPYKLEKQLGLETHSGRLPRVLDRMKTLGEPAIVNYIGDSHHRQGQTYEHVQKLISRYPKVLRVINEPTFRLLDPTELERFEFGRLTSTLISDYWNQGLIAKPQYVVMIEDFHFRNQYAYRLYGLVDRLSLLSALCDLRTGEQRGDDVLYFFGLMAAIECARASDQSPSLRLLQPNLEKFIVHCFGSLELADPEINEIVGRRIRLANRLYLDAKLRAQERAAADDLDVSDARHWAAEAYKRSRRILAVDRLRACAKRSSARVGKQSLVLKSQRALLTDYFLPCQTEAASARIATTGRRLKN